MNVISRTKSLTKQRRVTLQPPQVAKLRALLKAPSVLTLIQPTLEKCQILVLISNCFELEKFEI